METDGTAGGGAGEAFDPAGPADQGTSDSEQQGSSIFDPYLQSVPEASRSIAEGYLRDAEKHVNSRLSEAADLNKRFGAYKDIDLSGVEPQQLSSVVSFIQEVGQSPEAYQEWLRNEATEAGLIQAEQQEQAAAEGDDSDLESYVQSRIDAALNPLTQKLGQFEQSNNERAQADRERSLEQHVESSFAKIEADNKIKLTEQQQEAILLLSEGIEGDDFVEQGFARLRTIEGGAQAGLVKDKQNQPAPSLRPGGQPAPAKPKTFADVREQALEIINQAL